MTLDRTPVHEAIHKETAADEDGKCLNEGTSDEAVASLTFKMQRFSLDNRFNLSNEDHLQKEEKSQVNDELLLSADDNVIPDACDEAPVYKARSQPTARLAWVTRRANEIDNLLQDENWSSNPKVKQLYVDYLYKVSKLYDDCDSEHDEWLKPHKIEIDSFRRKLDNLLYPTASPSGAVHKIRKANSIISASDAGSASSSSSLRARVMEKKTQLKVLMEMSRKTYQLEEEEVEMRRKQELERIELKKRRDMLEQEAVAKEVSYLEQELQDEDCELNESLLQPTNRHFMNERFVPNKCKPNPNFPQTDIGVNEDVF